MGGVVAQFVHRFDCGRRERNYVDLRKIAYHEHQ
jgi:hypothetical protein